MQSPDACGACVRVWATEEGPSNATAAHIVKVVDDCLACQYSDIELSPEVSQAGLASREGGQRARCAVLRRAVLRRAALC